MTDVLTLEQRTRNMRNIRGKNTKPELLLRHALHALGLRYRLHQRDLRGCPDIVFPKYRAVIFVHGCFWHRHGCSATTTPATRRDFWEKKFAENAERDHRNIEGLIRSGWRVLIVWECALKGKAKKNLPVLCAKIFQTLKTSGSGITCMYFSPT
ncbi:MAG: DNA mismatch endonuclease Vsr [Desulfovibrio sp.]|jgi:DNA mismatch endonuclease (patch repair protein)|nr:DNA mismatch endonuclease Vsr [Desulfovibrio sp.]